jgi:hypothetical protein
MSWQDQFTAYTTGMAFNISLSHDHADLLAFIPNYGPGWRNRNGRSNFIPVVNGLIRRGLVEHNGAAKVFGMTTPGVKLKWIYRLTPAGERILELMKLAGVVTEAHENSEVSA